MMFGAAALAAYASAGLITFQLTKAAFETTTDARILSDAVAISAQTGGTVLRVYVQPNQSVRAGDVLVELDPTALRARMERARARWLEGGGGTVDLEHADSATEETDQLALAKAALAQAEARISDIQRGRRAFATASGRRASELAAAGLARSRLGAPAAWSGAGRPQRAADEVQALAALSTARGQIDSLQQDGTSDRSRRLFMWTREARRDAARVEYEDAQRQLQLTKIRAPLSGVTGAELPSPGEPVTPGSTLLSVWQVENPWVVARFDQAQLPRIKLGQSVRMHVVALDLHLRGTVQSIAFASELGPARSAARASEQEPRSQRVPIRVGLLPDQPGMQELRPGMSVVTSVRVP